MQVRELSLFITDLLLSGVCIQFSHILTQTFVHKHIICEALLKEIDHKSYINHLFGYVSKLWQETITCNILS